jgi:Spy/CpxP family protein refolding chaperone
MMNRILFAASSFALVATASIPAHANEQKPNDPKKQTICKSHPKTNSRFQERTCYTREQWDQMTEQNKRNASEMIDRPYVCIGKGEDAC